MKFSTFDIGTLRDFATVYYSNDIESHCVLDKMYPDPISGLYGIEFHLDICFVI